MPRAKVYDYIPPDVISTDNSNSSETPIMTVIPHMTMFVRPWSQRRGTDPLQITITLCLAHVEQLSIFLLYTLTQFKSFGFGRFIWTM